MENLLKWMDMQYKADKLEADKQKMAAEIGTAQERAKTIQQHQQMLKDKYEAIRMFNGGVS